MTTLKFKKFKIEAYKPGKSSIKKLKSIIKLSANESALGMSSKVKKIVSNKNLNFSRYPDGKSKELRSQINKENTNNEENEEIGCKEDIEYSKAKSMLGDYPNNLFLENEDDLSNLVNNNYNKANINIKVNDNVIKKMFNFS